MIRDQEKMARHTGGAWRFTHTPDEDKTAIVAQLRDVVIPADRKALGILDDLLRDSALTELQRECVQVQRSEIGIHLCWMRRCMNWIDASFHKLAGSRPYPGCPSMPEAIQAEIETSQAEHEFKGGSGELDSPRQRLMKRHRNDPVRALDLHAFEPSRYRGLDHWPGAHRRKETPHA